MPHSINKSRRSLLKQIAALPFMSGVTMAGAPQLSQAMGSCTPKSLVCIFLAGGADSFNMFVPGGSAYSDYRNVRNDLAVGESNLLSVSDDAQGSFGFNRLLGNFERLYSQRRMAVVANTGPLIRPTTQADYSNEISIPQSLFAHNTQQALWQNGAGFVGGSAGFGWGGRIADYARGCNGNSLLTPAFSIAGSNLWQSSMATNYISLNAGANVQYMLGYRGISDWIPVERLDRISRAAVAMNRAAADGSSLPMERELGGAIQSANDATFTLRQAFNDHPVRQMTYDTNNRLAAQLHYVARLISAREQLGMQQQVFFVQMGGWDTHSDQNERFPPLLSGLNEAVGAFQDTVDSLGAANSVTSFTASDFGRTLTSNGNGTDHGWGGHAFVFGGAVSGGSVYGAMPSFRANDNPDDAGERDGSFAGRIIPQVSVSQYGATIARWMDVPEGDLNSVFPDLANFGNRNLGFMV